MRETFIFQEPREPLLFHEYDALRLKGKVSSFSEDKTHQNEISFKDCETSANVLWTCKLFSMTQNGFESFLRSRPRSTLTFKLFRSSFYFAHE
jgi:hypothetical protein